MTKFWVKHIVVLVFFLLGTEIALSQDKEMIDRANKLFEKENYVDCKQDFLQLISLQPKNADFNFKYGVCLLYSDNEKSQALRYLNYAVKDASVDPSVFYFKGRAHHLNYEFSEAKKWYQKYTDKKDSKDKRFNVQQAIAQCDNGKKLLQTFTDIVVSEKKQIDEKQFFRLYHDMESIGGQILVAERFQSKLDKKMGHVPLVHFPDEATSVYYASYGDDASNGLDIYTRKRLPDGSWGVPHRLPGEINTEHDENFPFLHPSGDFLYFSSKGHNSMGGYDVFSSMKDPETGLFIFPENVDFAISSPDDDVFYVVDAEFKNAYFASARQSEQGKLHVYNVKVARVPLKEVIVMGNFLSEINPDNKDMMVTVNNAISEEEVGKIKSNQKGKYSFVFPRGGKYKYTIEIDGVPEPTEFTFDVPFLDEFRPLKQKVVHKEVDGGEIVQVINLFDERIEGGEEILAGIIRKKAQLNVNINDFDEEELRRLELQVKRKEILTDLGVENRSVQEISTEFERMQSNQDVLEERLEKIEAVGQSKQLEVANEIVALSNQVEQIQNQIDGSTDNSEKRELLNELAEIQEKIQSKSDELEQIEPINGEQLREELNINNDFDAVVDQFNQLVEEGKEDEAYNLLAENKSTILAQKGLSSEELVENLIQEKVAISDKIETERKTVESNNMEIARLQSEIRNLEQNLPSAKKKDVAGMEQQIEQKKEEINIFETSNSAKTDKIGELAKERNQLNNQIDALQTNVSEITVPSQEELEKVLAQAKNISDNLDSKSVENQLAELNQNSSNENNTNSSENENLVGTWKENYASSFEKIESSTELSEEEKINRSIQQNNETINQIDKQLTSSELTEEQKSELNQWKNELAEQTNSLEEQQSNLEANTTGTSTKSSVLNEVNSEYSSTKEWFESIEEPTIEMLDDQIALETSNQSKIQNLLESSETESKTTILQELLSESQVRSSQLEQQKSELEAIANKQNNGEETPTSNLTSDQLIEEITPNYSTEKENILAQGLPKSEELNALQELEQNQLSDLEKELEKTEKSLKKDETNPDLIKRKELLEELIAVTESNISENEQNLAVLDSQSENQTENSDVSASSQVEEEFASQIEKIQSSNDSDFEKDVAILKVEQEKIEFIENQIEQSSTAEEKEAWETQLSVQENVYDEKEQEVLHLAVQNDNQKLLNSIDKKYAKSIEKASSDEEKLEVENEYLSNLKDAVSTLENLSIEEKIENAVIEKEIAQTENRIEQLQSEETVSVEELLAQVKENNPVEFAEEKQLTEMDLTDLKSYVEQLDAYETELESAKSTLSNTSEQDKIDEEIVDVQKRKRRVMILVEDIEQSVASNNSSENSTNSIEVKSVEELNSDIASSNLTSTEEELLNDNLAEVSELENQKEKAKSSEEQNFLQEQINSETEKINERISVEKQNDLVDQFEEENAVEIESVEALKKRKRRAMILVGDLEQELNEIRTEQQTAKKKELPELKEKEENLVDAIAEKRQEIEQIDAEIANRTEEKVDVFEEAIASEVSFKEERDLATTESYKEYFDQSQKVVRLQKELNRLELRKVQLQNEIQAKIQSGEEVSSAKVNELKEVNQSIESKKSELQSAEEIANASLPSNEVDALKMKNLAFRKIQPIETFQSALEVVEMPRSGFEIDKTATAKSNYSEENPIPVDVQSPQGLVYRVQIGAFRKPIPQDLFKEFTPVSGEKIGNTGITRYMAGFFNASDVVVQAREDIRSLGYSDAFVVAYCDGERISFGEARRREREGTCVSKQMNELVVEIAEKTAEKQGIPLKKEVQEVSEYSYNKVPGAVEAEPIELMNGLFFTVQVGAYYRPVGSKTLFNLPEIKSYRAPNGMIKYCTGIFDSPTDAKPRQKQARDAGIVGPFIVAYLDGERIPMTDARRIMSETPDRLYTNQLQENDKMEEVAKTKLEDENIIDVTPKVTPKLSYQLVSQDEFSEYPQRLLDRLNEEGDFYFDENEKRVKSSILPSQGSLILGFDLKEIDPLTFSENLEIILEQETIPGAIMDWFVRQDALKKIKIIDRKAHLILSEVNLSDVDKINLDLQSFGVTYDWK